MSKSHPTRPSLPTSSSDFDLPTSSSSISIPSQTTDDFNPLLFRFRRPSLLAPKLSSDGHLASPLASSFTLPSRRRFSEPDGDKEHMFTDSSPSCSSENVTPPLPGLLPAEKDDKDADTENDGYMRTSRPQTPPRHSSSSSADALGEPFYRAHIRRLSCPVSLSSNCLPRRCLTRRYSQSYLVSSA